MKKLLFLCLVILGNQALFAQIPEAFNYQAIIRDASGQIIPNQAVEVIFSIVDSSNQSVYEEWHQTTTNIQGLMQLAIGEGDSTVGDFSAIEWSLGNYFIHVQADYVGNGVFFDLGNNSLLAVPYSMHAKTAIFSDSAQASQSAQEAEFAQTAQFAQSAQFAQTAQSSQSAQFAQNAQDAQFAQTAQTAINVDDADADPQNEIQNLTISNNTLSISSGNSVMLPAPEKNPWQRNLSGIHYLDGFVGIKDTTPAAPLEIQDTVSSARTSSLYAQTLIQPGNGRFHRGVYGLTLGENDRTASTFRAMQGGSFVENAFAAGVNMGMAGFADSATTNYGVFGRAGLLQDTAPDFNIGLYGEGNNGDFAARGVQGVATGSAELIEGVLGNAVGPGNNTIFSQTIGVTGIGSRNLRENIGTQGLTFGDGPLNSALFGSATGAPASGSSTNYGIYAEASGATTNFAGYFDGDVNITGTLSKAGGSFKIDHPQDPANKYLVHSFVESPEMLNIYSGNVLTDSKGYATVELPAYFQEANKDFRYQLTVIGTFCQAIIAQKLENNQFVIQTEKPGVEVSWMITGIRNDPWAKKNRIVPEMEKKGDEKGRYLHPELYDQPKSKAMPKPQVHKKRYQLPKEKSSSRDF